MKTVLFLAFFLAAAVVNAAELQSVSVDEIKALDSAALPAPEQTAPPRAGRGVQNVLMQIRSQPAWGTVEADDYQLGVHISVRKAFDGQYNLFNRIDSENQLGGIRKVFNSDWQLSGDGSYLSMREFSGSYTITGSVPGQGSQSRYINLYVSRRFDDFSYYISGSGMNLNVDRYGVNGSYDPDHFSRQAFTAALSMIFAIQADHSR